MNRNPAPTQTRRGRSRIAPTGAGFTLIELLVVIALLTTTVGTLLPSMLKLREAGTTLQRSADPKLVELGAELDRYGTRGANNLKQIALGMHTYDGMRGNDREVEPRVAEEAKGWLRSLCDLEAQAAPVVDLFKVCATGRHIPRDQAALRQARAALDHIQSETASATRRVFAELHLSRAQVCTAGASGRRR